MLKKILFFSILFLLSINIFSQTSTDTNTGTNKRELTVEEKYLNNAELQIIREQALTQDRDMKMQSIASIKTMIDNGKAKANYEILVILGYLASEGSSRKVRENRRVTNDFPEVRRDACKMLGEIGGDASKDILIRVVLNDQEPMVLSEAVYALGKIGLNDNNEVSTAIARIILSQDAVNPDNNFAYASLLSFEKIASQNKGLRDPDAFRAIIRIAQGNYITGVKQKAAGLLNDLKKYN